MTHLNEEEIKGILNYFGQLEVRHAPMVFNQQLVSTGIALIKQYIFDLKKEEIGQLDLSNFHPQLFKFMLDCARQYYEAKHFAVRILRDDNVVLRYYFAA